MIKYVRTCDDCKYNDGVCYTTYPVQYRCTITDNMHTAGYECDVEFKPEIVAHWEDCSNGWMCSACHRDNSNDTEYCPHCGARMTNGVKYK